MRVTASKRKLKKYILICFILLSLFAILLYLLLNKDPTPITVLEYNSNCEELGCSYNIGEGSSISTSVVEIIHVTEITDSHLLITFKIWNKSNNDVNKVVLKVKKSILDDSENFIRSGYRGNYIMQIHAKELRFPIPHWSSSKKKIFFSKHITTDIILTNYSETYLANGEYDYNLIKEDIFTSLQSNNKTDTESSLASRLFLFQDTLSKNVFTPSRYEQSSLYEFRISAEDKSPEDLNYSCYTLKKYYPKEICKNPTLSTTGYYVDIALSSEGFTGYDITELVNDSVIKNSNYIENVRGDMSLWSEYYHDKNIVANQEITKYIYSLLEYLNYSGYSCKDNNQEDICEEIYKLYDYSQYLIYTSQGNLCSRISYLPLLVKISENSSFEDDLLYILSNYPFESECTMSDGNEGFCAVDLKERIACMTLLSNSLTYYETSLEIEVILKKLVKDTLSIYLAENKGVTGLWGREDINLLTSGTVEDVIYPIKYYDFEDNYKLYTILEEYFDE